MNPTAKRCPPRAGVNGFTLLELFVVIAVMVVLAALIFPALSRAKGSAKRAICINHLKNISLGIRIYADDARDLGPARFKEGKSIDGWTAYKQLLRGYVGPNETNATAEKLFACPSDTYHYDFTTNVSIGYSYIPQPAHKQAWTDHSSYAFNGGNTRTNTTSGARFPGIAGRQLSSIKEPSRTILVAELPAYYCFSWHDPQFPKVPHYFDNAKDMAAFVDGHVSYTRFHYNPTNTLSESWQYDPPPGYDYKWSAD